MRGGINCPLGSWGSRVWVSSPEVLSSAELLFPPAVSGLCVTACPHSLGCHKPVEGPGSRAKSGAILLAPRAPRGVQNPESFGQEEELGLLRSPREGARCSASALPRKQNTLSRDRCPRHRCQRRALRPLRFLLLFALLPLFFFFLNFLGLFSFFPLFFFFFF